LKVAMHKPRLSFTDAIMVWGFLLALGGMLGCGCYEAFKILALVPATFQSSPAIWRNPMTASDNEPAPPGGMRRRNSRPIDDNRQ